MTADVETGKGFYPRLDHRSGTYRLRHAAAIVTALLLLFLVNNDLASRLLHNSDHAFCMLAAQDMVRGNWNLHGWSLYAQNFWSLDLLLYVLAITIRGFTPALMYEVPALTATLLLACAVWLTCTARSTRWTLSGALLTFSLLGILAPEPLNPLSVYLLTGTYTFTMLATLLCVGLLAPIARDDPGLLRWSAYVRSFLALMVMVLLLQGHPISYVILALPLTLVASVSAARNGLARGSLTVLSVVASAAMCVRFGGMCFVVWCVYRELASFVAAQAEDWIAIVLSTGCVANLAALVFNSVFDLGTVLNRYVIPATVFGAIVAGRRVAGLNQERSRLGLAGIGVLFVASVGLFGTWGVEADQSIPAQGQYWLLPDYLRLGDRLEALGLHHGYGTYWNASIVTVETRGEVVVRPVVLGADGISPWPFLTSAEWYREPRGSPTFLVWNDVYDVGGLQLAARAWGSPDRVYQEGDLRIAVWK